jgi:hypothetical protein
MEKQFTPKIEQPKPFEQEAVEAVERQAVTLKEVAKTPLQHFAAKTIRAENQDILNKPE